MINQPEDDGEEAKANGAVVGNNLAIEGSCHLEEINFETSQFNHEVYLRLGSANLAKAIVCKPGRYIK